MSVLAGEFPPAGAEMQAKILMKPHDGRLTVRDAFGNAERLDNAFAESPCNGPWHAIVRIRAEFEAAGGDEPETGVGQWHMDGSGFVTDGSGFVTDLRAPTAGGGGGGSGRALSVVLTAGHVLRQGGRLAKRVTVFSADGRTLAASSPESRRALRCTHAVCRDFTAAADAGPEYCYDYGAVFVDLGPCFFPNALHVDRALSVDKLVDCRKYVAAVAGYPLRHKGRPNKELVLGMGKFYMPALPPKIAEEPSTLTGTASIRAPLTTYTCDTSRGQSGGPVYFFDPIKRGRNRSRWQVIGIHMTNSPHERALFTSAGHTSLDFAADPVRPPLLDNHSVIRELYKLPIEEAGAFQECFNIGPALTDSVVADILNWPVDREEDLRS